MKEFVSAGDLGAFSSILKGEFLRSKSQRFGVVPEAWHEVNSEVYCTIAMQGVTRDSITIVGLDDSATKEQREACRAAQITPKFVQNDAIRLYADGEKPGVNLPISVTVLY